MSGDLPASLFVSSEAEARDITLADGTVHAFRFRPLRSRELARFRSGAKDDETTEDAVSAMIAACVVDDDGKPVLNFDQADRLRPAIRSQMLKAINEVNSPPSGNA